MATAPSISERAPRKFEPRTVSFPAGVKEAINKWLHRQIETLTKQNKNLFENEVPRWRKIVDGKPKEKNKSWPFPNCSNLVYGLVGETVDDLAARVLQLVWMTAPLVYFRYPESKNEEESLQNSDKEKALAKFIDDNAVDPKQLNLYPIHNKWFVDGAGLGKSRVCVVPEHRIEAVYSGYSTPDDRWSEKGKTLYEGPKVINLEYEDVLVNPNVPVFEDNDPIIRICRLSKRQLQERVYKGFYLKEEVEKFIDRPDRHGPPETKKRENKNRGVTEVYDDSVAEWDIHECYFSWYHKDIKFRLMSWYHNKTKTMANCVYNFIPENQVPIIETKLTVDGKGFAEMLDSNQEELSTSGNQLTDAITYGILGLNTIDSQDRNIDRNFTLFPGMFMRAKKDNFMHYEMANPAMAGLSLQNKQAMVMQAKERAGVGPPIAGMGAGSTNKKGQFGSMGTMAVLQAGNSRDAHRTSGFRYASIQLYSVTTDFYGFMKLGDTDIQRQALQDYVERRIKIPIRAADASMNKEVTKQNEIILTQAYGAFVKETSSLLQAYQNPTSGDPVYKKWLRSIIIGKVRMFQQIIKDFQLSDNPQEFCPDIEFPKEQPNAQAQPPGGGGPPDIQKVVQMLQQRGAGGPPAAPGGMDQSNLGPPSQGGGTVIPGRA
ncbi:MAG TPA: hypothetical protein VH187_18655 [Scandinavium sp.]|jgi:hypothetical protein|uniref:portal protein n=1 Tax=Scandinavium sp. TaxID=2830653 RepID=UPI002E30A3BB|nr:hypothetical protein [Scandinavium sp.]HEX4503159.1 hypothetical protein [Scandinavium sp.]